MFVADVVVFDVGAHRQRRSLFSAVEEHRGAWDSDERRVVVGELVDEFAQRSLRLLPRSGDDLTAALPGGHHCERDTAISNGSHAPWTSLVRFAARNIRSTSSRAPPPITTSHSGVPHLVRAI